MRQAKFENFKLRYHLHSEVDETRRGFTSIHCDYQQGEWFYDQLIKWLKNHIPRYALSPKELEDIRPEDMFNKVEKAAKMIYGRKAKTGTRGEIGELILHGIVVELYNTSPVISKIFRKSARSDTVKGFDCVHAVLEDGAIESLWLGEAKFYKNISKAITSAVKSIKEMQDSLKLRDEFMLISNDLDPKTEAGSEVAKLISDTNSLDNITPKICIPVLLTYESPIVGKHTSTTQDFIDGIGLEVEKHINAFKDLVKDVDVDIHVFVFSIKQKQEIIDRFDKMLKGHQAE